MEVVGKSPLPETNTFKEIYDKVLTLRGVSTSGDGKGKKIEKKEVIQQLELVGTEIREYREAQNSVSSIRRKLESSKDKPNISEQSSSQGKKTGKNNDPKQRKTTTALCTKCLNDAKCIEKEVDKLLKEINEYEQTQATRSEIIKILKRTTEETTRNAMPKDQRKDGKTNEHKVPSLTNTQQCEKDMIIIKADVQKLVDEKQQYEEAFKRLSDTKRLFLPPSLDKKPLQNDIQKQLNKRQGQHPTAAKDLKMNQVPKAKECMLVVHYIESEVEKLMRNTDSLRSYIRELYDLMSYSDDDKKKTNGTEPLTSEHCYQKLSGHLKKIKVTTAQTNQDKSKKKQAALASVNVKQISKENEEIKNVLTSMITIPEKDKNMEENILFLASEAKRVFDNLSTEHTNLKSFLVDIINKDTTKLSKDDSVDKWVNEARKVFHELQTEGNEISMQLKKQMQVLENENKDLQLRLSKLAGKKLTDGNPNITNLSDSNRPMKLGEAYSEMYDNEWTEVVDECMKKFKKNYNEDKVVSDLCYWVLSCFQMCKDKAVSSVKNTATRTTEITKPLMIKGQDDQVLSHAVDVRRSTAESSADAFYQHIKGTQKDVIKAYFKSMKDSPILNVIFEMPFYEKCVKLCWKMVLQDPQLMLLPGPHKGQPYDKTVFREYTSSGKTVVFTVWPALLLHENGPVLVKGVLKVE